MIKVLTPDNLTFNYAECEDLYNRCNNTLNDDEFADVIKRTKFYAFYIAQTMELIGCIYFYQIGRKLFMNGFAERHHHGINLECIKESIRWFKRNIYAKSTNKAAILCLLRCGFKKEKDLYVFRR